MGKTWSASTAFSFLPYFQLLPLQAIALNCVDGFLAVRSQNNDEN
ncbi:hypothetical protein [Calothrix sp. NIES-3974]|nr:hypothetical protein [Calothrix sp. NIES-3974]